jgi:hypothetical protein
MDYDPNFNDDGDTPEKHEEIKTSTISWPSAIIENSPPKPSPPKAKTSRREPRREQIK